MPIRVVQHRHGGPEVLEIAEVPRPTPEAGELLVRAHAAALNPIDAKTRRGQALPLPFPVSVGWDFAGVVEAVGDGVDSFAVGDRVFGMPLFPAQAGYGTYVAGPAEQWAHSPTTLDDVQAAAVPLAAITALQAFRDVADLQPGQRVLVHAAGGGVGHLAVQIAVVLGAEVVATASEEKASFVAGLGADQVIDYRSDDFVEVLEGDPVDLVLDLIGGENAVRSLEVTRPGGLVIGVPSANRADLLEAAPGTPARAAGVTASPDGAALREIAGWIDAGRLTPTVSETYDISDVQQAHASLDTGRTLGKIVLTIP